MRIEAAELFTLRMPLKFRFETSFGVQTERELLLLVLKGEGVEGYGEGVMTPLPLFREETLAGARELLLKGFLPNILGKQFLSPEDLRLALETLRGNRMAKAMVEMAAWDLFARAQGVPLYRLLGGVRKEVPVGVSLGIQESVEKTIELVGRYLGEGYRRIKLKIKPGWDVALVQAVREAFPNAPLSVDANSAYRLSDYRVFQALDEFHLEYIEQPLHYEDLADHARLQARIQTPLCLDESIVSKETARVALETDATRVINVKVARVGGHAEAKRVHDLAWAYSVPVWMGGMLEAGVGRAHAIHAATLPNYLLPGDTSSASRYWEEDIVNEPLEAKDGLMPVPEGPGIGVTLNFEALRRYRLDQTSLSQPV